MMICRRAQLTVSVFTAVILVAAATHADDSVEPESVLMTKHAISAELARTMQKAWADHLGVDPVVDNSIGMQLCVIPPGTFSMGSPRGEADRKSAEQLQEVTHTQPFLVSVFRHCGSC